MTTEKPYWLVDDPEHTGDVEQAKRLVQIHVEEHLDGEQDCDCRVARGDDDSAPKFDNAIVVDGDELSL